MNKPLRVGIIGMGGFAGAHHDVIKQLEEEGLCRLVCTCDPNPQAFSKRAADLRFDERGVLFYNNYVQMLDGCCEQLDLVTIPTPVPLHAPMHKACVERNLPVYLEKPPTLNYSELNDMIAVEEKARLSTNVGFNYIVEKERLDLKRRIVEGEFGQVRKVTLLGLAPRPGSYFRRAPWAGRLELDGRLVLDSCFGNAMAHFVHNVLFWSGSESVSSWADVDQVEAELYRANDIQGFDTVFTRAYSTGGVEILISLSHACEQSLSIETVICDKAVIHYKVHSDYQVKEQDVVVESGRVEPVGLRDNILAYFRYLHNETPRPVTRLTDCRPFVAFNSLLYAARRITTVAEEHLVHPKEDLAAIGGLKDVCDEFLQNGKFPSSQNKAWAAPGGSAVSKDLPKLESIVSEMIV